MQNTYKSRFRDIKQWSEKNCTCNSVSLSLRNDCCKLRTLENKVLKDKCRECFKNRNYSMELSPFEKLIVTQLAKEFPIFYGIWRLTTVFTRHRHWSLSRVRWISPHVPTLFSEIHSNIILQFTPRSFSLSDQNFACISHLSYACNIPRP